MVFHPGWHAHHFSCHTRCHRGSWERWYTLYCADSLIVLFIAQQSTHLIDSSLVWGLKQHGDPPSVIINYHPGRKDEKQKCRLKVKSLTLPFHSMFCSSSPLLWGSLQVLEKSVEVINTWLVHISCCYPCSSWSQMALSCCDLIEKTTRGILTWKHIVKDLKLFLVSVAKLLINLILIGLRTSETCRHPDFRFY